MYNGIGVSTARGTGTNGYVQRNLSLLVKKRPKPSSYHLLKKEEENAPEVADLKVNREILIHEAKRKMELKCTLMEELMLEQGYSQEEVKEKVSLFRKSLLQSIQEREDFGGAIDPKLCCKGKGTAFVNSHEIAAAINAKNRVFKEALGISSNKSSSAFSSVNQNKHVLIKEEDSPAPAALTHPKKTKSVEASKRRKKVVTSKRRKHSTSSSSSSSESDDSSLSSHQRKKLEKKHKKSKNHHKKSKKSHKKKKA